MEDTGDVCRCGTDGSAGVCYVDINTHIHICLNEKRTRSLRTFLTRSPRSSAHGKW